MKENLKRKYKVNKTYYESKKLSIDRKHIIEQQIRAYKRADRKFKSVVLLAFTLSICVLTTIFLKRQADINSLNDQIAELKNEKYMLEMSVKEYNDKLYSTIDYNRLKEYAHEKLNMNEAKLDRIIKINVDK